MNTAVLLEDLRSVLSEEQLSLESNHNNYLGNCGLATVYPYKEEDMAAVLKHANEHKLTVSVMGGGTKRGFGGLLESSDILLSLEKYKGVVEHTVGDMTITVKSGTNFQELQDYLAKASQKIPLDPFSPAEATIGGIIAANDSGPKRLKYGSARDSVIGLRTVYPDGTVIRSGGKVVKNVAGYDMNKLFIGSMGTLGVISEVTFKLRPLPKYESLVLVSFPDGNEATIKEFAIKVLDSVLEPVSIELLTPSLSERLSNQKNFTIAICFEDVETSVQYQEEMIKALVPPHSILTILNQSEAQDFWKRFYELNLIEQPSGKEVAAVLKLGTVNLDVIKVLKEAVALQDLNNVAIEAHGGLGHGLCQATINGSKEDVVNTINEFRKTVGPLGGYVIVKHLPYSIRKEINVWGEKPTYFSLLEGIKTKVDPNRILNPKRFVGGI
ncbi:FAD-binding oxidoreductase [Bacillus sp. DTU_2020_1000418_1_SI_GHA_SEK_038]|uniref:FAD-binding oxidoreductase n=1 Tax=Bacillus sp. DTU_2020_1000418_1_SI_GHA_SEK_038 TaxID=3077585 RepID=UPI0028E8346F|nr:FAD-binding oxidoreductase [Bacillus sp. DTU_2020_1000418_1_SI_GHA_SEK_038]WNS73769.1 FAD-binding oxidoreductase [Bacillus sp. DTU_2020_1000418_1_SI_GHA_SEK_038]